MIDSRLDAIAQALTGQTDPEAQLAVLANWNKHGNPLLLGYRIGRASQADIESAVSAIHAHVDLSAPAGHRVPHTHILPALPMGAEKPIP